MATPWNFGPRMTFLNTKLWGRNYLWARGPDIFWGNKTRKMLLTAVMLNMLNHVESSSKKTPLSAVMLNMLNMLNVLGTIWNLLGEILKEHPKVVVSNDCFHVQRPSEEEMLLSTIIFNMFRA